jgi:xylan 1,4-beta-xylosidase
MQLNLDILQSATKLTGSGIFDVYKPIPGTIQAVHYNLGGEGLGYHDTTSGNAGGKYNVSIKGLFNIRKPYPQS